MAWEMQISAPTPMYPMPTSSESRCGNAENDVRSGIAASVSVRLGNASFQTWSRSMHGPSAPSLSPDFDTNMTTILFSLIKAAPCLQRAWPTIRVFTPDGFGLFHQLSCRQLSRWPRSPDSVQSAADKIVFSSFPERSRHHRARPRKASIGDNNVPDDDLTT